MLTDIPSGDGTPSPPISPDLVAAVKRYLVARLPRMVDLLTELVLLESPSLEPERQVPVLERLAAALEDLDLAVTIVQGKTTGGHLEARPRGLAPNGRSQLLLGHCDTVWPVGTLAEMPMRVADGRAYGPGTYDMKAGLVQMIFALHALRALEIQPALPPLVFVNTDEEIGSEESAPHLVRLAASAERVFVLEPSLGPEGKIKTARKGVGQFLLAVHGRAAHAGLAPEEGVSAILEMAHQVQALAALNDPNQGVTVNVGMIRGGVRPNVVAPLCEAEIDVRVLSAESARWIDAQIRGLQPTLPGARLTISGGIDRPPLEPTARNQALWARARAIGAQLGLDLTEGMAGGASDGNLTSPLTATLDGLGPVGDGAHARHEHVEIAAMAERSALLALLMLT